MVNLWEVSLFHYVFYIILHLENINGKFRLFISIVLLYVLYWYIFHESIIYHIINKKNQILYRQLCHYLYYKNNHIIIFVFVCHNYYYFGIIPIIIVEIMIYSYIFLKYRINFCLFCFPLYWWFFLIKLN